MECEREMGGGGEVGEEVERGRRGGMMGVLSNGGREGARRRKEMGGEKGEGGRVGGKGKDGKKRG